LVWSGKGCLKLYKGSTAKIKDEFGAKRIVSVGEATHGAHEFQAIKFKIFQSKSTKSAGM
jgi:hypothetical protein